MIRRRHNFIESNRELLIANGRELLTILRVSESELVRLRRHSVVEIATIDLRLSLGILAKRIRGLVRNRKGTIVRANQPKNVVFLVTIAEVKDDCLYNYGDRRDPDRAKSASKWQEHDSVCAELDAKIRKLEGDVQSVEKRLYSLVSVNATALCNISALDSFARALDLLHRNIFGRPVTGKTSFVVCDVTDCDQCAYRQDDCVTEKINREKLLNAHEI